MAPNMVTFIGWIFVILSYSVMLFYDYTFTKIIPSWTFLFAAVSLFIYSTLDAIDGKQARRTNSSSPLGQLFDHGCDSFSMSFFVLAACQAVRLEPHGIFFVFMAAQVTWWSSNWLEYQTGVLKTNVGGFGVTETELICIVIHLLTGLFGQEMWDISLGGLSLKEIVVYFVAVTLLALCAYSYASLLLASSPEKRTEMLLQVSSLVGLLIIEYIWMKLLIYDSYNGIILLNFGIFLSLSICKIIVSSVTKVICSSNKDGTREVQPGDDNLLGSDCFNAALRGTRQSARSDHSILDLLCSQPYRDPGVSVAHHHTDHRLPRYLLLLASEEATQTRLICSCVQSIIRNGRTVLSDSFSSTMTTSLNAPL